jgi:uncharacterized protein
MLVGIVSDTHGLVRPEALASLRGVDHLVHAGDIGGVEVLAAFSRVAPVTAVRGNNDHGDWAQDIPATAVVDAGGVQMFVLHDVKDLDLDPAVSGFRVVVSGHSHVPSQEWRDGVLYFNPGSAGPRRFRLPIAVGLLTVDDSGVRGEIRVLG